jgi:DNA invertase Pin-like site-specific DNA recombinase
VAEYRDAGVSGTRDLDDREGLGELIQHIRSNGVRLVLVGRADRLARDLLVSEVILGQFRDLGVRVVAADSGTDLTAADEDPTHVLIRQCSAQSVSSRRGQSSRSFAPRACAGGEQPNDARAGSRSVSIRARNRRCIAFDSCVASPEGASD